MALSIISSNRVEALQQSLSDHISSQMLRNPFEREIIVVPTYAIARWLNLKIAQQQGIAANIDYPLPANWVWRLASSVLDDLPTLDPLSPDIMRWRIFQHLPELSEVSAFAPISHYLQHDPCGVKRWQLCARIAEVFERYQHYRPDMIKHWSDGAEDHWQAKLWRVLIEQQKNHRSAILDQLRVALQGAVDPARLPERISLFALSSLPPLLINLIHALARHITVRLYQHCPTDQYWSDLKNQKSRLRLRLATPQQAQYYDTGSELLTSWGRQGQILQDLLLNNEGLMVNEHDAYQPPPRTTLLHSIQHSIFALDDSPVQMPSDDSISVHICHSPMRECQVLHDQLLDMMQKNPELRVEDILVMAPEISRYAPYIEAVFQSGDNNTQPLLAWNLSDITLADEHPLALTFLQLLKLPQSRFSLSDIFALLDIDEIKNRFDIDQAALQDIRQLLDQARVRWAIDARHKHQLGLPPAIENTWLQAKQRLLAGYAMAEDSYWHGIAAIAQAQGDRAISIGKFWRLFERLQHWRHRLAQSHSTQDWRQLLLSLLDDFFAEPDSTDNQLQHIRDVVAELGHGSNAQLSAELVSFCMEQALASRQKPGRLFSGGITFCGMRPMRCLPFKVICLLGMNDGDFPRREHRIDFDLMNNNWMPGDPLNGDEDRYLMLETLLCARQSLYISYCGRSLKDNSECMPSVLVRELLDFIDAKFVSGPTRNTCMSEQITTVHPMQAFAAANFQAPMQGYSRYWCDLAIQLVQPKQSANATRWSAPRLKSLAENSPAQGLDLMQLARFLKHPIKYFFQQRLKIHLTQHEPVTDEEVFDLDNLQKWQLRQRLASDHLNQRETDTGRLSAEGLLPHGPAAYSTVTAIAESQQALLSQLATYQGLPSQTRHTVLRLNDSFELRGAIRQYFPGRGLMQYVSSKMQGKHLLSLWIDHLAMCAAEQFAATDASCLIANDQCFRFAQVDPVQALSQLQDYIDLYWHGLQYPLAIFPAASYVFASKCSGNEDKAIMAAYRVWHSSGRSNFASADADDPYIKLALRNNLQDPLATDEFRANARMLYQLALARGEVV